VWTNGRDSFTINVSIPPANSNSNPANDPHAPYLVTISTYGSSFSNINLHFIPIMPKPTTAATTCPPPAAFLLAMNNVPIAINAAMGIRKTSGSASVLSPYALISLPTDKSYPLKVTISSPPQETVTQGKKKKRNTNAIAALEIGFIFISYRKWNEGILPAYKAGWQPALHFL